MGLPETRASGGPQVQASTSTRPAGPAPPVQGASQLGRQPNRILEALLEAPGLNIDEISALLRVRRTAANHHLRILMRLGLVVVVRQGRHALHFLSQDSPTLRKAVALLRVPTVFAVAHDLFRHPQDTGPARAARLEISQRQVRRAVGILRRHDLARVETVAGRAPPVVHLHPEVRLLMARGPNPFATNGHSA